MKYFTTFFALLLVYLLLAGFQVDEVVLGSIVSASLTFILIKYINFSVDIFFPLKLVKFVFIYLPVFIWKLVLANLDVARRVLSPKIPLNPGIVKVDTKLKGEIGKLTLANSITLTPGTLSIDVEEDSIFVHAIDIKGKSGKDISGTFEKILGGIFK